MEYPYALSKNIRGTITMHWKKIYKMNCNSIRLLMSIWSWVKDTLVLYGAVFGVFLAQILKKFPINCSR